MIPKHGGYRKLRSFQTAQLVYDGTVLFCNRFIGRGARTSDQMVQAARSGVQNIAEGSKAVGIPTCHLTDEHIRQGFARRHLALTVKTLRSGGDATVSVHFGIPGSITDFERVIAVPMEVVSGALWVDGPEECEFDRTCPVPNGHYRMVVAQRVTEEDEYGVCCREDIQIFLERVSEPLQRSEILVADPALDPPDPLVETAEPFEADQKWKDILE